MKKRTLEEMHRLTGENFREAAKMDVTIVLDNVRSMMNTGAVFRTADAFRAKKIWLCGITATPPHREIHKTALGATETVDWSYAEETQKVVSELKELGAVIVAVELMHGSISPEEWIPDTTKPLVLVFGNEIHGIHESVLELCDCGLEIPQHGTKHSLNIAVSAGIVLWETYRRYKHLLG
jgi:23S rRNA (guanosine2251-2'-O)-methyltransferase